MNYVTEPGRDVPRALDIGSLQAQLQRDGVCLGPDAAAIR